MKLGLREVIFILLLMGIPVAAYAFVFRPQNLRNAEMLRQIEARQERLRELNTATATIGDLKKEIASLEEAVRFFQSKLPNEKEMDKVLREIWRLAEANQLMAKSIRTLPVSDQAAASAGPHEQPITVKLEGDFRGFYGFLQSLENQPRIMRISKMTVGKLKDAPEGQVQVDFDMSIFFDRAGKEDPCPPKKSS
jgi:Tfp pilus assembly protein PilO